MNRRELLKWGSLAIPGFGSKFSVGSPLSILSKNGRRLDAHIVIVGGGVGGCAAALAAARSGYQVIMTEETDWIGGQLTQQAVPPDEHPWIEQFGATQSYRTFRNSIREYYRTWYPLRTDLQNSERFNPGACGVSYLCHEPRAALAVLNNMMAPYISKGTLNILLHTQPISATTANDRILSIQVRHTITGQETELSGLYFLDATEMGELLPLTNTEYVTGAESQQQTGEAHAPVEPQPDNIQAMTWCFAIDYKAGEDHTIEKPSGYEYWRDYIPELTPPWPGRLLSLTYSNPITLEPRTLDFDPRQGIQTERFNLWEYRRLRAPSQFVQGAFESGISLINWPQNDYLEGSLIDVTPEEAEKHKRGAKEVSLALLYWLQTEAPRPDGGQGWAGLRLRGDVCGTRDGLAKYPYIRESRRIKAIFTVLEQHVGLEARMEQTNLPRDLVSAASFPDTVGIGSYRIDLHPSTKGDNYIDISSLPFEIPLGALIPQRVINLLPACKNLGVTHITNGCYRLHPVEWNIGESAALTAVQSIIRDIPPQYIHSNEGELNNLQRYIQQQGIEIRWPKPATTAR